MKRINLLDIETTNKIAAGEVVERPSSVVKELVENSIDAGAKNIVIEIENGGEDLVKILDDGIGIHPEDIEKAFCPHATSKINKIEDIYAISTLGFRGEALASIASVSKASLVSKIEDSLEGKEIYIEGGRLMYTNEVGANRGTLIQVKDLFYNVPARKKFLKSPMREAGAISDIITRISLANPDISFTLINNGKKVINTFGKGSLKDTIRNIYGRNTSNNLISIEKHFDMLSVHGFIGDAELSRGSRNNQSIFVNKRYIKSRLITAAVENAFKSFLTINKYPFFVLFIDIFPEYIDVNIHPTKSEIKFNDEKLIYKSVFDSVHSALKEYFKDSFQLPEEEKKSEMVDKFETISFQSISDTVISEEKPNYNEYHFNKVESIPKKMEIEIYEESNINNYSISNTNASEEGLTPEPKGEAVPLNRSSSAKFPSIKVIGQYNKKYILGEFEEDLYIIDQHAAHEKILFERYREEIKNSDVVIQPLLIPAIIELSPEDYYFYLENAALFVKAGFIIEEFGGTALNIKEAPYILGKLDFKSFFMSMLDNIKNLGSGNKEEVKFDAIARMACRSAIKANEGLELKEMTHLLEELRFIEDPFTCPHGRPVIIKFTNYEMDKKFKRIQ